MKTTETAKVKQDTVIDVKHMQCELCEAENSKSHPVTGLKVVLVVAHLDQDPKNNCQTSLRVLCQNCLFYYNEAYQASTEDVDQKLYSLIRLAGCIT